MSLTGAIIGQTAPRFPRVSGDEPLRVFLNLSVASVFPA